MTLRVDDAGVGESSAQVWTLADPAMRPPRNNESAAAIGRRVMSGVP
jgi:hypothetical protein